MAESEPQITIYRHVGCPYCERVIRKAHELEVPYHSRFVVPEHSERDIVKHVSGTRTVPVIVDQTTDMVMAESANIIKYLEARYGDNHA